ncbi:endonuclease/exonuclease/phosphatase family protein [Humidisolicoccus flavus]|uniref:endonuclease/exonuclease/phosphatase family protein n=1 Tax=Humidisolicoccus flavus TaxID=3111414 RepID=UPI00324C4EF3
MFLRILAVLFCLAVAAALLISGWPGLFGLELAPVIAQVVSLRAGVIMIALTLMVIFILISINKKLRAFGLTIVAMLTVFCLASGGVLISRGVDSEPITDVRDGDVLVLTWNTLGDAPGIDTIANVVQESGADIVTLPETTRETGIAIANKLRDEHGNPFWVHSTVFEPGYGALNTTLLISASLGEYTTDLEVGQTRTLPTIVARPSSGEGPVIVATHPVAPVPTQMRNWRADLEFVAGLCEEPNIIIGGDFNSTLDHWSSFASDGGDLGKCVDAGSKTGTGGLGTWTTEVPSWLGTPIDHVLASQNWEPIDSYLVTDHDDVGSDHRPLLVQLRAVTPVGE